MAVIPVLAPPPSGVLAQPYLTDAAFKAYPHWLDLDNLIPGGVQSLQDNELADVLLAASDACITLDEGRLMRLDGHYVQNENHEIPVGRDSRVTIRPRDVPVRGITAVSYGCDPSDMLADPLPNASAWLTNGRMYGFRPGGPASPVIRSAGGRTFRQGDRIFISMSYVAGFPSTFLAEACAEGDTSLTLADATSVLPGDVLRIFDVGYNEQFTVDAGYVPQVPTVPPAVTEVPITAAAKASHESGILATGMPRAILQAVICFAIAFLLREDVSEELPVDPFGTGKRTTDFGRGGQAGGLINDALGYLEPYRSGWRP